MKKYAINRLDIEIGRWCNMTCRHCYKGKREKLSCRPEFVDKFLDNISMVHHLYFCGGESSFYIDEMKQILEIFRRKNIPLNHIRVNSNILVRSEKFVDFLKMVGDYATNPEVKLLISKDRFHLENMEKMGIDYKQYEETKKWYMDRLPETIIFRENNNPEEIILIEGNAKELSEMELVAVRSEKINIDGHKNRYIESETIEEDNIVMNDAFEKMQLSAEGYIFIDSNYSYETQRINNHELSLGHVENDSLENMIEKWNKNVDTNKDIPLYIVENLGFDEYIRNFIEMSDMVRDAVNSYDNEKLLSLKEEATELMERYKSDLNINMERSGKYHTQNSKLANALVAVSNTLTMINTLLDIPNGFWRKMGMKVIDFQSKKKEIEEILKGESLIEK